jgi:hypothetical protein
LFQESLRRGAAPEVMEPNNLARDCASRNAQDRLRRAWVQTCHHRPLACPDEFSTCPVLNAERIHIETITSRRPEANDNLDGRTRYGYARQVAVVFTYEKGRNSRR